MPNIQEFTRLKKEIETKLKVVEGLLSAFQKPNSNISSEKYLSIIQVQLIPLNTKLDTLKQAGEIESEKEVELLKVKYLQLFNKLVSAAIRKDFEGINPGDPKHNYTIKEVWNRYYNLLKIFQNEILEKNIEWGTVDFYYHLLVEKNPTINGFKLLREAAEKEAKTRNYLSSDNFDDTWDAYKKAVSELEKNSSLQIEMGLVYTYVISHLMTLVDKIIYDDPLEEYQTKIEFYTLLISYINNSKKLQKENLIPSEIENDIAQWEIRINTKLKKAQAQLQKEEELEASVYAEMLNEKEEKNVKAKSNNNNVVVKTTKKKKKKKVQSSNTNSNNNNEKNNPEDRVVPPTQPVSDDFDKQIKEMEELINPFEKGLDELSTQGLTFDVFGKILLNLKRILNSISTLKGSITTVNALPADQSAMQIRMTKLIDLEKRGKKVLGENVQLTIEGINDYFRDRVENDILTTEKINQEEIAELFDFYQAIINDYQEILDFSKPDVAYVLIQFYYNVYVFKNKEENSVYQLLEDIVKAVESLDSQHASNKEDLIYVAYERIKYLFGSIFGQADSNQMELFVFLHFSVKTLLQMINKITGFAPKDAKEIKLDLCDLALELISKFEMKKQNKDAQVFVLAMERMKQELDMIKKQLEGKFQNTTANVLNNFANKGKKSKKSKKNKNSDAENDENNNNNPPAPLLPGVEEETPLELDIVDFQDTLNPESLTLFKKLKAELQSSQQSGDKVIELKSYLNLLDFYCNKLENLESNKTFLTSKCVGEATKLLQLAYILVNSFEVDEKDKADLEAAKRRIDLLNNKMLNPQTSALNSAVSDRLRKMEEMGDDWYTKDPKNPSLVARNYEKRRQCVEKQLQVSYELRHFTLINSKKDEKQTNAESSNLRKDNLS